MPHHERDAELRPMAADDIGISPLYAVPRGLAGATAAPLNHFTQALARPPLSCFVDLLNDQARCNQPVDREALIRAWGVYKEKSDWNPIPVRQFIEKLSQGAQNAGGLLILFTYLPIFIIAFFAIWGMVGLKMMRSGMGLALTFLLVFFLYIMTVVYRSSIQAWLASKVNQFLGGVAKAEGAALEHVLKAPQAAMAAVCEYTGCPWQCPNGAGAPGPSCRTARKQ